jgi:hypothetical protein
MRIFTRILLFLGVALIGVSAMFASYMGTGLQKLSEKKLISSSTPGHNRVIRGGGYRYGK